MKIHVYNIQYDTDGVSVEFLRHHGVTLPETITFEVECDEITEDNSSEIADAISDETGFCVFSFDYRIETVRQWEVAK